MKTPGNKPHWQGRQRHVVHERMAWYGEPADERYWYDYWKARLTPDYYASAEALLLQDDELGRILLRYMPASGLHLEAGCGAGYWVAALSHQGMRIEGIEYARELVGLVRAANPRLPVRWGNALAIDRPGEYFDTYLSIGVVEHRVEGPEPFLAEAYRVLKPGGRIIIAVPFYGPLRRYKNYLATAGFFSMVGSFAVACILATVDYLATARVATTFPMWKRPKCSGDPCGRQVDIRRRQDRPALPFFQYGFSKAEFTRLLRKAGFYVEYAQPLYVHRLLQEELMGYDRLASRANFIKTLAERLFTKRDGHMLVVVGQKPGNSL